MTLSENINRAIADFEAIKQAIINKGVAVPAGTPTSEYGELIGRISGGSTENVKEWNLSPGSKDSNVINTFISNAKYNSNSEHGWCGYNSHYSHRLDIGKENSSYNSSYFPAVDLTSIDKIIVSGATWSNLNYLSSKGYYLISDTPTNELTDNWIFIQSSKGSLPLEFSIEIDCTNLIGEKYIHFAVEHGSEAGSYTSYIYLDNITFVYS